MIAIARTRALEILDSRGNPTVSVSIALTNGITARAQVPSGASTGKHEACELRDGDPRRYAGKGVIRAAANVNDIIGPALAGSSVDDQERIDRLLIELDGSPDKSRLGANAILGVSCAVARARAALENRPLWASLVSDAQPSIPLPMVNILSGGLHAGSLIEVQDYLAIPHGWTGTAARIEAVIAIHRTTREWLNRNGYAVQGVADEGGWGPALPTNETALGILTEVIESLGYGGKVSIAIDAAASHFFAGGAYALRSEDRRLSRAAMIGLLAGWVERYPLTSIEDGLDEDDWEGWTALTQRLGPGVQLIGDDLFATNPLRLRKGVECGAANSILVKMNQIGTLTETFEVLRIARLAGYTAVVSARSGDTEDSFLADLAVASGAGWIKIGSVTRSERLTKYNRLLEIEREELGSS